jgi:hypothetical protein
VISHAEKRRKTLDASRPRGSGSDLVGDEALAYRRISEPMQSDLHQMEKIKEQLNALEQVRWERPSPPVTETFGASDGTTWDVYAHLVELLKGRILLCCPRNRPDWCVTQEFDEEGSTYARIHGHREVLIQGQNVQDMVMDYVAQANHALRFSERNLMANAQMIVWRQFPQHNLGKVVEALMEHCNRAFTHNRSIGESQSEAQDIRRSRGTRVWARRRTDR